MKKLIRMIKLVATSIFLLVAAAGFVIIMDPPERVIERQIKVAVEPPTLSVKELVETIPPKYGIEPIVMAAIIERESGGRVEAIRFEPGQMGRAAKITKNSEQQRMFASSHGLAQIMGWWAPELNMRWSDLYDPETNIEAASAILKKCHDRSKANSKVEKLRSALACYNGSNIYANEVIDRIGTLLIEERL